MRGKKIVIAISGSIAAYKIPMLVRLCVQQGLEVKVIMTEAAKAFVSPLTLSTLSKNAVWTSYYDMESGDWHNHVELALWADLMLIAPATANTLAKMQSGICDSLLLATYLSAKCPVLVAPAMDLDMWDHTTTQKNINQLREQGVYIIEPGVGFLASGLEGKGRMAEPEEILQILKAHLDSNMEKPLQGKSVMITAGPTREPIDAVRYISNSSTGKMGVALATRALELGAHVILVHGPLQVPIPKHTALKSISVQTALEMCNACAAYFNRVDVAVFAAAVADYTVLSPELVKSKKQAANLTLHLTPTQDIAATFGKQKLPHQKSIGFALETHNAEHYAMEKLVNKNLDMIVLNTLEDPGAGFGHDTNQVTLYYAHKESRHIPLSEKQLIANHVWQAICEL